MAGRALLEQGDDCRAQREPVEAAAVGPEKPLSLGDPGHAGQERGSQLGGVRGGLPGRAPKTDMGRHRLVRGKGSENDERGYARRTRTYPEYKSGVTGDVRISSSRATPSWLTREPSANLI